MIVSMGCTLQLDNCATYLWRARSRTSWPHCPCLSNGDGFEATLSTGNDKADELAAVGASGQVLVLPIWVHEGGGLMANITVSPLGIFLQ